MINTYQTSLAPPPLPPRFGRSQHPVLIPAPAPSQGHYRSLIWLLAGVVVLHVLLSVGGFIFLYHAVTEEKNPSPEGEQTASLSSERQETSHRAMARMIVEGHATPQKSSPGYLQWDIKHSFRRNIRYYRYSWLTILQSGDYYVYSRVTFSKDDPVRPLVSIVKLRKNETEEAKEVMLAYCSLDSSRGSASIPQLCTATQGEVISLEKGNQLSIWVQDLSLVDYTEGATAFGMYKL